MKKTCHRSEELLLQGDVGSMRTLERHAARCAGCAKDLEDWREISAVASTLRAEWSSEGLWPKIEQQLRAEKDDGARDTPRPDIAPFDESADREFLLFERGRRAAREEGGMLRSFTFGRERLGWLAAAALLVLVVGGGSFVFIRSQLVSSSPGFEQWVLQETALQEVEKAEQTHMASIDRLAELVGPAAGESESALMLSYREKLVLLDDAIEECRSQINENRQNAHLRRQLLAIYGEKDRTLRELMKESSNVQQ